jgi:hypothetical protein
VKMMAHVFAQWLWSQNLGGRAMGIKGPRGLRFSLSPSDA